MLDLQPQWLEDIKRILSQYIPNIEVRAFGSRVAGKSKKYSDLDLVIMEPASLEARTMAILKNAFDESKLPIKVDIIEWATISDSFKTIIEKQYEVIQCN